MMEAKMKAAKHVDKHGRSEPWSNGERCDPKKESQIRNARHRHAQLMHSPNVHSPCAQPLDDGWLPDVKMLQLQDLKESAWRRTVCVVAAGLVAAGFVAAGVEEAGVVQAGAGGGEPAVIDVTRVQ